MSSYLLRTEKDPNYRARLLAFTDEDDGFGNLTSEQKLAEYLKHLILLNYYSGIGPLVKSIWRWNEDDTIDELAWEHIRDVIEVEHTDSRYRVYVKDLGQEIITFTVEVA